MKQQTSCHTIEKQAVDEIERSIQRRLAIDSLAVAVRDSRNAKDVLPVRRTREPYETQREDIVNGAPGDHIIRQVIVSQAGAGVLKSVCAGAQSASLAEARWR